MQFFHRNFLIFFFSFIFSTSFAQYNGGESDGSANDLVIYSTCTQTPDSYFAYFGGNGDGSVLDTVNYNACSQTPLSFYAYFGGIGDGERMDTVNYSMCSQTPLAYYAYFGGNGDGENIDTANYNACTQIPLAYYAYFGGNGDGESIDTANYNACTQIPLAYYAYFGGNGDGYAANQYDQCVYFPPIAGFTVSDSTACTGQTISFTDTSSNIPFTWEWLFPGGMPSISNIASPDVIYNTPGTYSVTLMVTNSLGADTLLKAGYITVIASPPTPAITANGSTIFCQGGNVILTSSASTGNMWSDSAITQSITVASSGVYTVTVTGGNGCYSTSAPDTVIVNSYPSTPTITTNGPTTFCQGGNVTLTSNASTSYAWSNGATTQSITVTASDSYTVTLTNAGCSVTSPPLLVTVNPVPATPTITANGPTTFCQGGNVILTSSASTGNTWSNSATTQSITVSSSGSYTTTVDSAGCPNTSSSVSITVNTVPATPGTISGTTSVCDGSSNTYSITSVSGATSYTWTLPSGWSGSSTTTSITTTANSTSGNITVIANNSCGSSSAQTYTVSVPVINTSVSQLGGTLTADASGTSYQWINCNSNTAIAGETNQSFSPLANGDYAVVVTQNGCSDTSSCYTVFSTAIRTGEALLTEINVYPNPSTGVFIVDLNSNEKTTVSIYNVMGKLVYSKETSASLNTIDLSSLAQGIYSLKVVSKKNNVVREIVITK